MYIRRVKFSRQSTSFATLLGKNVGRLLYNRRAHTEPKTAMSPPHVFFCIVQCYFMGHLKFYYEREKEREREGDRDRLLHAHARMCLCIYIYIYTYIHICMHCAWVRPCTYICLDSYMLSLYIYIYILESAGARVARALDSLLRGHSYLQTKLHGIMALHLHSFIYFGTQLHMPSSRLPFKSPRNQYFSA